MLSIERRVFLLSEPARWGVCFPPGQGHEVQRHKRAVRLAVRWKFHHQIVFSNSMFFSSLQPAHPSTQTSPKPSLYFFMMGEQYTLSFQVTSERPHVILVSLNHITFLHALPSPLVFLLKNSRIPSFSPNFASIHISPPPCVLVGGCQGRYGSESSSDGNEGDGGFAAHYAHVYC